MHNEINELIGLYVMASRKITDLHPRLQPICTAFMHECAAQGLHVFIVCTYRSALEQDREYARGRSVSSGIGVTAKRPLGIPVTNARGGQSAHNFTINGKPAAKAFDIGVLVNGRYDGSGTSADWKKAGEIGMRLGLDWYGRAGAAFKELPHFQLKD